LDEPLETHYGDNIRESKPRGAGDKGNTKPNFIKRLFKSCACSTKNRPLDPNEKRKNKPIKREKIPPRR